MTSDSYRVEILHYINPHLLWVEVENTKSKEFIFEQIGVYGVLPQEVTVDDVSLEVETRKCDQWTPAAFLVMKKVFSESLEVWFSPVHIDRRTSIFDDNIHKYGELVVKKKNGKLKALTQQLVKSGFALYDTGLFHQELGAGNLKTKLNTHQKQDVIKQLEKSGKECKKEWEMAVKRNTKIFHRTQDLESMLTVHNLHQHEKVQELLQNKIKDFDRCKDADENSLGRASLVKEKITKMISQEVSKSGKKKLEILKGKPKKATKNDTENILLATKKFLEQNSVNKEKLECSDNHDIVCSENMKIANYAENHATTKHSLENSIERNIPEVVASNENDHNSVQNTTKKLKKLMGKRTIKDNMDSNKPHDENIIANAAEVMSPTRLQKVKRKNKSPKVPAYDINCEKRVAYGPPGLDQFKLPLKIVPLVTQDDVVKLEDKVSENLEEAPQRRDAFDGLDSEVNIKITNQDILKKIHDETLDKVEEQSSVKSDKGVNKITNDNKSHTDSSSKPQKTLRSIILQRKLKLYKEKSKMSDDSLSSSDFAKDSSTSVEEKDVTNESDDDIEDVLQKLNLEYTKNLTSKEEVKKDDTEEANQGEVKTNANPFKNLDATISVFVDKLVTPVLMVHTKMNKRIQPCMELRDVNFNTNIHVALANMSVKHPMMIQSVSWFTILRGYSLFMVSPLNSGKTLGYLPAVCRLVTDYRTDTVDNVGPSCIIVCATAKAASEVEKLSKIFLGLKERVLTCYTGMDELHITTALLNGCDLLICTPSILVRLMQVADFGVDLRRLATFVLDDCERLSEVYINEVKFFLIKIKEMLKTRANKELRVQIVAASRIWCDFMGPLAKKAPNSVVCIGAFQECVLYSKANTKVTFVKKENKINAVLEFLKLIDGSKRTVIVCRDDKEVETLEKCLVQQKKVVFACNNTMTVQDLYNYSKNWEEYQEPLLGPILVCCDGNLTHLNVTNAHYLIHFSLPQMFSMFCKRFAVLNDNYPSIFKTDDENVKIQVLLEESNVEQLPKILNFIKRCTNEVPQFLDDVCSKVLAEKDGSKAKNMVPVCDNLLAMGDCPDFWNCQERHAVMKEYDEPKEWMPKNGVVTFKILHYHTAVLYSVRLLSNVVNGKTVKYPQTYSTLSLKMGMYYSKESNKKLHGVPKVGDVCAVSVKLNFFARCQVMKILSHYKNGNPNYVLIKLIDEEKFERCSDVYLYYLPDELRNIETHIVRVRLANVMPKDKDVTFSDLALNQLKRVTDKQDLYLRGKVSLAIGNCVLVDTLEACQDLTSLNETVVSEDFRKILLDAHAIPNPEHVPKLEKLCHEGQIVLDIEKQLVETPKPVKNQLKPDWAHLDNSDMQSVYFTTAESPDAFFVRLVKFDSCMNILLKDIEKHVTDNSDPVAEIMKGDYVLAKFPDDNVYERARIDEIYDENKVKCFFVDQGDWRDILRNDIIEIPEKFLIQMPCQAIECRLAGVSPAGESWTEFGTNWFNDTCFEDNEGNIKQLYIKYFTKGIATHTDGHKYGVVLIDTNGDQDIVINQLMIEKNLAQENPEEVKYFQEFNANKPETADCIVNEPETSDSFKNKDEEEWEKISNNEIEKEETQESELGEVDDEIPKISLDSVFARKPIRSMPLVQDDDDIDRWDINITEELLSMFRFSQHTSETYQHTNEHVNNETEPNCQPINLPAIKSSAETILDSDFKSMILKSFAEEKKVAEESTTSNVEEVEKKRELESENNKIENKKSEEIVNCPKAAEKTKSVANASKNNKIVEILDSDDISSSESNISAKIKEMEQVDELRKPKVVWRQRNDAVIIKIQLIGVESYDLEINDRTLRFETNVNNTKYSFNLDLYGVIDNKSYYHSNKGLYILINLKKVLNKRWLTLTKDGGLKKWIAYDVDAIDTSSDEEAVDKETIKNVVKNMQQSDSDSDDDFVDDSRF
ncbi:putative ATP-dependent RNA helicase TDRD12 [Amyelois transitella]|uniref:putative ATP-dependent RNA helicase TDRD12 n=1 Tax=Amyelois transitella TaxID=680683 RepID=UPI00067B7CD0|nr:putative ATP-dependent RNA helicase TDRD12 [Amyelois transitella]